jgi:hypothetical protein
MVVGAINAPVSGPTCFNKKNQNLKSELKIFWILTFL